MVDDLGPYLKNDNGKLSTSIIYFKDKTWSVYDVKVKFCHHYEEINTQGDPYSS
jgi:hypothetical protein